MPELDELTHETFAPCIGQVFSIDIGADEPIRCELVDARARGEAPQTPGRRQAFSLIFRGPLEPVLAQRIYRIGHATLGELDIFLVPVGPEGSGMGYEAVFN